MIINTQLNPPKIYPVNTILLRFETLDVMSVDVILENSKNVIMGRDPFNMIVSKILVIMPTKSEFMGEIKKEIKIVSAAIGMRL